MKRQIFRRLRSNHIRKGKSRHETANLPKTQSESRPKINQKVTQSPVFPADDSHTKSSFSRTQSAFSRD